jgi:Catalase
VKLNRELYKEYPQPNEDEVAQKIVTLMKDQMVKNFRGGVMLRDVHSKGHGCVRGEFIVEPDLPDELRVGVFKEAKTFPAVVRFSNAGALAPVGGTASDTKRDVRGMAIKLIGVEGAKLAEGEKDAQTQDFLLFSADIFFSRDPTGFLDLMVAVTHGTAALVWYLLTHLQTSLILAQSLRRPSDLLNLRYFSAVPSLFGEKAVKYSARPVGPAIKYPKSGNARGDHYLRERLAARLASAEVSFDFMVQFQKDPYSMPIEDASVQWSEDTSPFVKVATLRIPQQQFDSESQLLECEHRSFNPWHSLPEHRPLGFVGRARRSIYTQISTFRHERNEVPRVEPTGETITR